MNACQKKCLDRNLVTFCESLDVDGVLAYLQSRNVLREHQVDEIKGPSVRREQRRLLIKTIKTRAPDAFGVFHDSLLNSGQGHLARLLAPCLEVPQDPSNNNNNIYNNNNNIACPVAVGVAAASVMRSASPEVEDPDPGPGDSALLNDTPATSTSWSRQGLAEKFDGNPTAASIVTIGSPRNHLQRSPTRTGCVVVDGAYKCRPFERRGALIIKNNHSRYELCQNGSKELKNDSTATDIDNDRDTVRKVFQSLGYTVTVLEDLGGQRMLDCIRDYALDPIHKEADSSVVTVITRGDRGNLIGVDDEKISISDFISALNIENCPSLASKPKLFFLQLASNAASNAAADVTVNSPSSAAKMAKLVGRPVLMDLADVKELERKLPTDANILVAFSIAPDYGCFDRDVRGSFFLQSLCKMLQRYAKTEDLLTIITKVNGHVAGRWLTNCPESYKHIPECSSTLINKFYFYPPPTYKSNEKLSLKNSVNKLI